MPITQVTADPLSEILGFGRVAEGRNKALSYQGMMGTDTSDMKHSRLARVEASLTALDDAWAWSGSEVEEENREKSQISQSSFLASILELLSNQWVNVAQRSHYQAGPRLVLGINVS